MPSRPSDTPSLCRGCFDRLLMDWEKVLFSATEMDTGDLAAGFPSLVPAPAPGDISYHGFAGCHLFSSSSRLDACGRRCHANADCV